MSHQKSARAMKAARLWVRVNGSGNAWPRRVGCGCRRCVETFCPTESGRVAAPAGFVPSLGLSSPRSPAHSSVSILVEYDGRATRHVLFDCGSNVLESLALARLPGIATCTVLWVGHPHPDHLNPNALIETYRRAWGNDESTFRLQVYGSDRVDRMVTEKFPYERKFVEFHETTAGTAIELGDAESVPIRVTPLAIAHGRCTGARAHVVEALGRRIVVAFDIDVPDATTEEGKTNQQVFEEARAAGLLTDVALLALDANTFRARGTGHNTVVDSGVYLDIIRPARTLLVHYSGHEDDVDDGFGWLDDEVETAAQRLHGPTVGIGREGQMLQV